MLNSLLLKFFQKHRKKLIEFDPRITTIIGVTEAGKSTILRALKWLVLNQFDGKAEELIRWGATSAYSTLEVDKHTITRKRSRTGTNAYELDGKEFKAFGLNKVPDPVANVLRLTEANFQNQLDQHFWFSQSAGEVSRELNKIVNLSAIDNTLAAIATQSRRARAEVEVSEKRLQDALNQRTELAWVGDIDKRLRSLEKHQASIDQRRLSVASLLASIKIVRQSRDRSLERSSVAERASQIITIGQRLQTKTKRAEQLEKLILQAEKAERLAKRTIGKVPDPAKIIANESKLRQLRSLITKIENLESAVCLHKSEQSKVNERIQKLTKGKCPVCGKSIRTL